MSGRAIVITSGKGGVGKTTATANIGIGLAKHDRKIVMVDGDIGLRNLDIIMGLENRIIYHLVDVVCGRCQVRQALVKDKRFPSLFLLPASQVDQKEAISPEQMRDLATQLKEEFDFVLIDCPAGIEQGFRNAVAGADEAIVITTPDVSPVRDADRVIGLLQNTLGDPQLIINRMATDNLAKQLSCSWTFGSIVDATRDQIFQQYTAQGQSFFQASGDSGASPSSARARHAGSRSTTTTLRYSALPRCFAFASWPA